MAKILVTGASGFIGFHLVRALLAQGHEISCLVRKSSKLDRLAGLPICRADGDVTDAESLRRVVPGHDAVYHLAGLIKAVHVHAALPGQSRRGRQCRPHVCRPDHAAGPAAGFVVGGDGSVESCDGRGWKAIPLRRSRTTAEASWPASKRPGVGPRRCRSPILRPPVVFGEADPATYAIFRPIARFGVHVVPSWRTHRLSLIHADDLLQAMVLAAQRGKRILRDPADGAAAAEGCYFVPAERDLTFAEMGRMMGAVLGRRRTWVLRLSPVSVWTFGLVATAFSRCAARRGISISTRPARPVRAPGPAAARRRRATWGLP